MTRDKSDRGDPRDTSSDAGGGDLSPEELDALRKAAAERDDVVALLQRKAADFDNYQKRVQRDMADRSRYALQEFVTEILQVLDNLERAELSAEKSRDFDKLLEGVGLVKRQFEKILSDHGVSRIDAEGKPFDPAVHEAVVREERSDLPQGTVVGELRRGYKMHDRVIRPAQVRIAMRNEEHAPQKEETAPRQARSSGGPARSDGKT